MAIPGARWWAAAGLFLAGLILVFLMVFGSLLPRSRFFLVIGILLGVLAAGASRWHLDAVGRQRTILWVEAGLLVFDWFALSFDLVGRMLPPLPSVFLGFIILGSPVVIGLALMVQAFFALRE